LQGKFENAAASAGKRNIGVFGVEEAEGTVGYSPTEGRRTHMLLWRGAENRGGDAGAQKYNKEKK